MNTFSIGEAIGYGWNMMKKQFGLFILLLIIPGAWSIASAEIMRATTSSSLASLLNLIFSVVTIWLGAGLTKTILKVYDEKQANIRDLFSVNAMMTLKYFVVTFLYGLMVGIGLIALIVPGVYLALKYMYAGYYVIDKDAGVGDAFKMSSKITKGSLWQLLLLGFVEFGIILLGFIVLVVGIFVAAPIVWMAGIFAYRLLIKRIENAGVFPTVTSSPQNTLPA